MGASNVLFPRNISLSRDQLTANFLKHTFLINNPKVKASQITDGLT